MSSSPVGKACLNPECKHLLLGRYRKGWRCRNGEYAELCDRCGSSFEEGRFCDTFHARAPGWRSCEFCGKRVHCGCIASAHCFVFLDTGGIECLACARKNTMSVPNPALQGSLFLPLSIPDRSRLNEASPRNWGQISGTSSTNQWNPGTSLFRSPSPSDMRPRMPFVLDASNGIDRLAAASFERNRVPNRYRRLLNENLEPGLSYKTENGRPVSAVNCGGQASSNHSLLLSPCLGLDMNSTHTDCQMRVSDSLTPELLSASVFGKPQSECTGKAQSERLQANTECSSQSLSRCQLLINNHMLQAVDSHSRITPLFEKMLSASDAGKIGRIVLPKKCAETHLPPIEHPEGLPLKVHDTEGKEWVFHFRFWPNNNSRMYVLEGITPCIQSMQLQTGDIVTFGRSEPEGKLIMGFRKAAAVQHLYQDKLCSDVSSQIPAKEPDSRPMSSASVSQSTSTAPQAGPEKPVTFWSEVDKSGYIAVEAPESQTGSQSKKKNSLLNSNKRLRLDSLGIIELKVTFEEAQGLIRQPGDRVSSVVIIEDFEIEEYEDPPVIGRPAIIAQDRTGEEVQWMQCEDCSKWRRIPLDVCVPFKWTCSNNSWDPDRCSCSAAQEIETAELQQLFSSYNPDFSVFREKGQASKKKNAGEELGDIAHLPTIGERNAETSQQPTTTRHPRHKPGCSCIVCNQPPSGHSPKHMEGCTCNFCSTMRRRSKTQMLRRGKKILRDTEYEQERSRRINMVDARVDALRQTSGISSKRDATVIDLDVSDDEQGRKSPGPHFKVHIDLNSQPEREEDQPSNSMTKFIQDATERYAGQKVFCNHSGMLNFANIQRMENLFSGVTFRENNGISRVLDHPSR